MRHFLGLILNSFQTLTNSVEFDHKEHIIFMMKLYFALFQSGSVHNFQYNIFFSKSWCLTFSETDSMFVSSEPLDLTTINVTQKLDMRLLERLDLGFPAIKDQQFQSDLLIAESIQQVINSTNKIIKEFPQKSESSKIKLFRHSNFSNFDTVCYLQYIIYSIWDP